MQLDNKAELINHWRLEETFGFNVISMNLSRLMNKWKKQPLLDLIFLHFFGQGSLFLSGNLES